MNVSWDFDGHSECLLLVLDIGYLVATEIVNILVIWWLIHEGLLIYEYVARIILSATVTYHGPLE